MSFGGKNRVRVQGEFDDKISGPLAKARDSFDRLGKSAGAKAVLQGVGIGAGIGAWSALSGAISATVDVVVDSIRKAEEEQAGLGRLDAALAANIKGWDGNRNSIEKVIAEREKLAFSDGEQRDALAQLVTRTHDVSEALDLERRAMDLARLKGIDLATASTIIGKVYSGNTAVLTRYGIAVSKGATGTEALAQIQKAAAGQAEKFGATTQGTLESLRITVDDLQEEFGTALLPAIKDVATWARDDLVPAIREVVSGIEDVKPVFESVGRTFETVGVGQIIRTLNDLRATLRQWRGETDDTANGGVVAWGHMSASIGSAAQATAAALSATTGTAAHYADIIGDAGDETDTTAGKVDDLRAALGKLHGSISTSLLDSEELKSKYRESRLELQKDIAKLRELEAIKNPTRDQRIDIEQTTQAVIDDKRQFIDLTLKAASLGEISFAALVKRLQGIGVHLSDLNLDARTLLNLLTDVGTATGGSRGGSKGKSGTKGGQATGGFAPVGWEGWVGEEGPERARVTSTGVYVTNADQSQGEWADQRLPGPSATGRTIVAAPSGSGQPVVIQLVVDGAELARIVDRHLYYEAARAPQSTFGG